MSTFKNGYILLYFHFNSILKRPRTCSSAYGDITDFWIFEICEFYKKTQKSRYLENETLFVLQIKEFINYMIRATLL